MSTYTYDLYLSPTWNPAKPNLGLLAGYTQVSSQSYTISISGPGLPAGGVTLPKTAGPIKNVFYGETYARLPITSSPGLLKYTVSVTVGTTLTTVTWSGQVGTKPDGQPLSFQAALFCNDTGADSDFNDCVVTLQLFSGSAD